MVFLWFSYGLPEGIFGYLPSGPGKHTAGTPGFAGAGPGRGSAQRHQRGPPRSLSDRNGRSKVAFRFFSKGQLRREKAPPNMGFNTVQHGLA